MLLIAPNSPNGLDLHNRNANGLRCIIALHNCLKGRILISFCLVQSCFSGRAVARFLHHKLRYALTSLSNHHLTYGYENYCLFRQNNSSQLQKMHFYISVYQLIMSNLLKVNATLLFLKHQKKNLIKYFFYCLINKKVVTLYRQLNKNFILLFLQKISSDKP